MSAFSPADPMLVELVRELVGKYKCHSVILYGSHARGDATAQSDYDIMGVRKSGKKFRLAQKRHGRYIDIFVFSEKDLKVVGEDHVYMNGAKVLYDKQNFGAKFQNKLSIFLKKKYKPLPPDEIKVRRVWLHKMFDRIAQGDIEGKYRRSWLHEALLYEYFNIRRKRYWGSKQSFQWLKQNDLQTYKLFEKVLSRPLDLKQLRRLVERVSGITAVSDV